MVMRWLYGRVTRWTRNKLPEGATPEFQEILATNEIAYLYFNRSQNQWSTPKFLTNDLSPDGVPSISLGANGQGLATWTHAKDDDPATRDDLEIHVAHWNGQQWASPSALTNNVAADYDVQVGMDSKGNGVALWIHDADADLNTIEDINVMYSTWQGSDWSSPEHLILTNRGVRSPRIAVDGNDNVCAVWIERQLNEDSTKIDHIMFTAGNLEAHTWSDPEIVFSDSMLVDEPCLSVCTHAGEVIAMVSWRGYDGMDGDLFVKLKNLTANTPWTEPTQVTQDTFVDWMSAAVIDNSNNAMFLSVKTDIHNPDTDNSQLGNFMDGISYLAASISPNLTMPSLYPEFLLTANNQHTIDVRLNRRDGTFAPQISVGDDLGINYGEFTIADFTGNGVLDFVACTNENPARLYLFTRRGHTAFQQTFLATLDSDPKAAYFLDPLRGNDPLRAPDYGYGLIAGDLDNDGDMDFLENINQDFGSNKYWIAKGNAYLNDGTGDFTKVANAFDFSNPNCIYTGWTLGTSTTVVDVDGDGYPDLLASEQSSGAALSSKVYLLKGNGDGTFQQPVHVFTTDCHPATHMTLGDFNNDGKVDAIVGQDDDGDPGAGSAWTWEIPGV